MSNYQSLHDNYVVKKVGQWKKYQKVYKKTSYKNEECNHYRHHWH